MSKDSVLAPFMHPNVYHRTPNLCDLPVALKLSERTVPRAAVLCHSKHVRVEENIRKSVSGRFWRKSFGFWVILRLIYSWVGMLFHS